MKIVNYQDYPYMVIKVNHATIPPAYINDNDKGFCKSIQILWKILLNKEIKL